MLCLKNLHGVIQFDTTDNEIILNLKKKILKIYIRFRYFKPT